MIFAFSLFSVQFCLMKKQRNYTFIDGQNLHVSLLREEIRINYGKLRRYLREKYQVEKVFSFIGYLKENEDIYKKLKKAGYILVFKKTTARGKDTKGNCDSNLIVQVVREWKNFEKAVIISGDGDFLPLLNYLQEHDKLLKIGIPTLKSRSFLLKKFRKESFFIENLRGKLKA